MPPRRPFLLFRSLFAIPATLVLVAALLASVRIFHDEPPVALMVALVALLLGVMIVYLVGIIRELLGGGASTPRRAGTTSVLSSDPNVLGGYAFDLLPVSTRLRMRLNDAGDYQDAITQARLQGFRGAVTEAMPQDAADPDAVMRVWLLTDAGLLLVGALRGDGRYAVAEAVGRLERRRDAEPGGASRVDGDTVVLPAEIVTETDGLAVDLLTGLT